MQITYRTQNDGREDEVSLDSALHFGDEEESRSFTRQEDRDSTDINLLLLRFGVLPPQRAGEFGRTVDYSLDLQMALNAIEEAQGANLNVPPELRDKYPTWREVLNGAESGEYERDLTALAAQKEAAAKESTQ